MDDSESSHSPLDDTPVRSRRDSSDQPRRGHRSSRDRDKLNMGSSSRELARLLVYQEREAKDLRKMLSSVTEQLKAETQRADEAEMRAREAAIRFKSMNDAKVQAQQDSERNKQTLELYKLQLDNAQREINKAQQIIDAIEAQRIEAEEVAARARTTARRLKEEKLATLAREEGRREGYEEGLAQGRNLGFEEGRAEGYARGRAATARSVRRYADELAESPVDERSVVDEPGTQHAGSGSSPDEYGSRPPSGYVQSLREGSPGPERARSPGPNRVRTPGPLPAEPPIVKDPEIRPIPVHYAQSPGHPPMDFPPDNFIPKMDEDGRIRLPPQHEMGPPPPTPSPPPSLTLQHAHNERPLMVPPPGGDNMDNAMTSDSDASTTTAPVRPRHRRRRSTESESTTMSQFEILGPPVAPSALNRTRERPHVLSAIAEERERSSSMSSPSIGGHGSPFVPSSGSTFYQPLRAQASISSSLGHYDDSRNQNYYTNPRAHTSSPDSTRIMNIHAPASPSSLRPPSQPRHSRTSSLSPDFNIEVEPPSGPESVNSESAPMTPNLLSANNLPPMPPAEPTEPVQHVPAQVMSMPGGMPPPPGQGSVPIFTDGQLPPGFQPIGPPMPQSAFSPMGGSHPGSFQGSLGPAGVPLPPSTYGGTPSVVSTAPPGNYPATEPVIPHLMPTATPSAGGQSAVRYSRTALRDSSSDSDDAVSSAMGSVDSLTTPPSRHKHLPPKPATPLYQEAPIPPNVVYPVPPTPRSTSSRATTAARVPLPPSASASVTSPTSTAGYPYSQTSYSRSNVALDAGRTPVATSRPMSPLMGSARGTSTPLPVQSPRMSPYDIRTGSPEYDLTRANTMANALPPQASPRASTAPLGSPVIPEPSLAPTASTAKGKKTKKKKGK
ncbi:uncharacterized protein B0H18DRAFT_1004020 [Fomitopsis serialis]|uniref:uncharacterized protein n=1 Tax=Fomitopsis serialis TaxID=139415 RepID=UPI0020074438|nr:uncharacterized protein B0H18DRAFT_1004020 [Neoantrodia serialis]KAH9927310.1 hypothetical protein B0H18DRAFT_1004020 [Neoantrodia serialis]